jgi:hypothetical protein
MLATMYSWVTSGAERDWVLLRLGRPGCEIPGGEPPDFLSSRNFGIAIRPASGPVVAIVGTTPSSA